MTIRVFWQKLWKTSPLYWPWRLAYKLTDPVPPGVWLLNAFVQRILRINGEIPWMVHYTSTVGGDIQIGKNVFRSFALSGGCYIQGINGLRIGDDTLFAAGVKIISANHDFDNFGVMEKSEPLVIGRHCWIGANAVILPGVTLGDNVVVGAGAVVTKSIPDNTIVAGVPARPIGQRKKAHISNS
jgi:acetyltransferase-like isoleucine patch superfamily enzyme